MKLAFLKLPKFFVLVLVMNKFLFFLRSKWAELVILVFVSVPVVSLACRCWVNPSRDNYLLFAFLLLLFVLLYLIGILDRNIFTTYGSVTKNNSNEDKKFYAAMGKEQNDQ